MQRAVASTPRVGGHIGSWRWRGLPYSLGRPVFLRLEPALDGS
jgi:hypothetical protein